MKVELRPPGEAGGALRPTGQMERVSKALEEEPGLSKRAIRTAISGRNEIIDLALELLIAEGFVDPRPDGRATAHHSVKPFREVADEHDRAHVPDRAPNVPQAPSEATVPRAHSPLGVGHVGTLAENLHSEQLTCPDDVERASAEFERLRAKGFV